MDKFFKQLALATFLVLLLSPELAFGSELEADLAGCALIEKDQDRLDCLDLVLAVYDLTGEDSALSGLADFIEQASAYNLEIPPAGWSLVEEVDPMTDLPLIEVSLRSEAFAENFTTERYQLKFICRDRNLIVKLFLHASFRDDPTLKMRFGEEAPVEIPWAKDNEFMALNLPDIQSIFVIAVEKEGQLAIQAEPILMDRLNAEFDLSGAKSALIPIRQNCLLSDLPE